MKTILTNQVKFSRRWYSNKGPETRDKQNQFGFYEENDEHYLARIEKELKDEC